VKARLASLDAPPVRALQPGAVGPEIVAMVDGLDQRLAEGGGSEAEWERLIRSMMVLGRNNDARDRLARAKAALAGDPAAAARLDQVASSLGAGPGAPTP
jgi:cytochrome c-type biogenesis protein CcmH